MLREIDTHDALALRSRLQGSRRVRTVRSHLWFLLLVTFSLPGCAYLENWSDNNFKVGPEYREPIAAVASEWIEFNDPQMINEAAGVGKVAWWECFGDPILAAIVQDVHQQNLTLRAAGHRVQQAESQRAIAVGQVFPQLQEVFGNFEQRQRSALGFSQSLPPLTRAFGVWSTAFNASWEIDLWGRYRRGVASADADLAAWQNNYCDVLLTLTSDTAATYVELRSFQERLRYLNANIERQEKSVALAKKRFANGIVTKLDVTQGEASLSRTRALAPILDRGLRQAGNRLCVLSGRPPIDLHAELAPAELDAIPKPPEQIVVGIPANLLRRRPDVRRAERRVAAQSERIGIAAADLYPTFSLNGAIGWQANDIGDLVSSPANTGFISPGFNWNILNYHRIVNNVSVQDATFQQLSAEYAQTVLDANREVEDAMVDFQRSKDRATELAAAVEASLESLFLAQLHYDEGWIDFDRLNNLQVELVSQQDQAIAARADVIFALIRIYRALGGGWQPAPTIPFSNESLHDGLPDRAGEPGEESRPTIKQLPPLPDEQLSDGEVSGSADAD